MGHVVTATAFGYYVYGNNGDDDIRFATVQASGGSGDDVMVGTPQRDVLWGDTGDDVIRGRQGRDFLDGEEGSDRIAGGGRIDELRGGPQADRLDGRRGNDLLLAGDVTGGGHGKHVPVADDVLRGGAGRDTVGYPDTDRDGGVRVDLAEGLATRVGHDQLRGIENVSGGPRGDVILGDEGRNVLIGNGGGDHIIDRCDAETEVSCER